MSEDGFLRPPPNRFTHEVVEPVPFYFRGQHESAAADGTLEAGAKVVLLVHEGRRARVVDERGLYVEVSDGSLRPLGS